MSNDIFISKNSSFTLNQKTLINPIDLGTRIKSGYINDKVTIIKKNTIEINDSTNDFIIKNQTTNYIDIDTSNNIVNINVPLKLTGIISNDNIIIKESNGNNFFSYNNLNFSNDTFTFSDDSNNLYFQFNKPNQSIDISANICILNKELNFIDTNNEKYLGFDTSNQLINLYKPLNLDKISFSEQELLIQDLSNNKYLGFNSLTKITNFYQETNDVYASPIIKYNIISENAQNFEKKYVAKTSILNGSGVIQYYFKNVIDNKNEQITFRGKIISRDLSNNSASFIFDGFTKYINPTDTNYLEFEIKTLYTSDNEWKVNTFFIYSTDLVIEVQSNQNTTTNWVVSIESVSV
jgi:hypothetical protein